MSKKILVLTGSPRKGGNSETLANAFIKGAESKGHEVTVFNAAAKTVQGCRACDACWSKGNACVFDDGFRELAPMLDKVDVLALASPVYWFGMSAQIKSAIDKMYSFAMPKSERKMSFRETVLLMSAEDTRPEVFTGSVETYKAICEYLELTDRGMVLVTGVGKVGEMAGNPALKKAEELGASI